MPTDHHYPLARWADGELSALSRSAGAPGLGTLTADMLLGERAVINRWTVPGRRSAGGGSYLFEALGDTVAINLARPDDCAALPALFGDAGVKSDDLAALSRRFGASNAAELVERGRLLGLAIAGTHEGSSGPSIAVSTAGRRRARGRQPLLVIDLSGLWAGPLAANLLQICGAQVIKVESRRRPDAMREGDPALFARLNGGKASVSVDLQDNEDRHALLRLIGKADVVIDAARPRALRQHGIDADAIVRETPGLVWVSITAHGGMGDQAQWVGFGDDAGVAGGLSDALMRASGQTGFVGDAAADPLTGIHAARTALDQVKTGTGARLFISMRDTVALALAAERALDARSLDRQLRHWAVMAGKPFPSVAIRDVAAPVRPLGTDSRAVLGAC